MIDVGWLAETGPCKMFKAGQSIPCPGVSDSSERVMYILIVGRVDVFTTGADGSAELLGSLLPGDVFGGREFFTDVMENVYATITDSVVYVLSESSFNELSWAQPDILFEVLRASYAPLRKLPDSHFPEEEDAHEEAPSPRNAAHDSHDAHDAHDKDTLLKGETRDKVTPPKIVVRDKSTSPKAAALHETAADLQTAVPTEYRLFPEGHKSYPGITKPEYKQLIYPKDYVCPFCKKEFMEYKVFRSKLYEAAPIRYDLRRFYTDFQTEWYDVITCPGCYFSMLHNYYTEPKPLQKAKIENELTAVRASVLLDFEAERDLDFVLTTHYLAMLCAEGYRSLTPLISSKLWGNLSWLYEDVGDEEMMRMAADRAAAAYEEVYAETRLTPVQEQITCLSIAGMQQRAGVDRNMKKFLFTAKTVKPGDQTYSKLAEDFLYDIRAEDENN